MAVFRGRSSPWSLGVEACEHGLCELIADAREELDQDKRMGMLVEAERILVTQDAGTAPMYFQGKARLQKPYTMRSLADQGVARALLHRRAYNENISI